MIRNNMTVKAVYLSILFSFYFPALLADEMDNGGKQLFTTYCAACHGMAGGMDMSKRLAPPIIAVKMHYIDTYPDKQSFVKVIADWVEKPDESKTMMRGAIRRFKLMPAMSIARGDIELIANYIFSGQLEKPAGFDQHFQERHGKKKN